jgi:hypothetical protein
MFVEAEALCAAPKNKTIAKTPNHINLELFCFFMAHEFPIPNS